MSRAGKIGIVTVIYNSVPVLDDFVVSLSKQKYTNFILYAVDNASHDGSVERLNSWADPRLRVISNSENLGIAEGNNQGARAALAEGCDSVLFMNNDVKFESETLAVLADEFERLDCDLLEPKVLYGDGKHIWWAGAEFSPAKAYLAFHAGQGELDEGQFEEARRTQHCPACCLLVRPSVFDAIGMFDPKYFVYWDDGHFSYKAWRARLMVFYTPRAKILHKVSTLTGGSTSDFVVRYNMRGHVYFMLSNLGLRCLYYVPAMEVRLIFKLLSRSISWRGYVIRQRAFLEGFGVWLS
jgi:GT2 family glycosyltransferase